MAVFYIPAIALLSQEKKLLYHIKRGNTTIGTLHFTEVVAGNITTLKAVSQVNTWIIIPINVSAREEAVFEQGILLRSSVYRKVNGSEKVHRSIESNGSNYLLIDRNSQDTLRELKLAFNLLNLFTTEPAGVREIYSVKNKRMLPIHKIADRQYRLMLPGGNYQDYHYKQGTCTKIEIHESLFTAIMVLQN